MNSFLSTLRLSFNNLLAYLPAIAGGILCIVVTLVVANFLSKIVSKYSLKRTSDSLIANFIGKVVWSVVFIFGTVLALGILGLGTISNKILAGAGITTFIIGFALKDIGENFLSGLILAFSRPYRVGSFIECDGVKGVVKDMTMRQTTVEAENGKIIMIPNSMILKNPLTKHSGNDNNLQEDFTISVETIHARNAAKIIADTINGFNYVSKGGNKPVKIIVEALTGDKVKLLVVFWFDIDTFTGSRSGSKSEIMLTVLDKLQESSIVFSD
jgi:small conductance mechanosensitive channel